MNQPPIVPGNQPYQPPPGYGPPPPQPVPPRVVARGPSTTKIVLIILGCLLGVGAICGLLTVVLPGLLPTPGGGGGSGGEPITVKLEDCTSTGDGFYRAHLTVTNNSDRTRSAVISIEYVDSGDGTRLAQDVEFVNDLAPGQTSREESIGHGSPSTTFRCLVHLR